MGGSGCSMLVVREQHLEPFKRQDRDRFEEWMVEHIARHFSRQFQSLGAERVREMVRYGIANAATYGITSKREVCKYIDLSVVFGRNFDRDARHAWAGQILNEPWDAEARVTALQRTAMRVLGG